MRALKKYVTLFVLSWQNSFVYRVSFFLWRFRQMLSTLMALTVWSVIFNSSQTVFGYTSGQMLGYILLISLLQSFILASALHGLAGEIYSGSIAQHMLKPQKLFMGFAAIEAADKTKNVLFSALEGILLLMVFKPPLSIPSLSSLLLCFIWCLMGVAIHFYITILFGTLGFWSPQTWGPKFLFFMFLDFTAGKLYPLDILPASLQQFLFLTPFPYLSYVQIQVFLGKSPDSLWQWWLGISFWLVASWWLASYFWKKGTHSFEAAGN